MCALHGRIYAASLGAPQLTPYDETISCSTARCGIRLLVLILVLSVSVFERLFLGECNTIIVW